MERRPIEIIGDCGEVVARGTFLCFSTERGAPVAIVEMADGSLQIPYVETVRFVPEPKKPSEMTKEELRRIWREKQRKSRAARGLKARPHQWKD
jgi:hypothetical protein